MKEKLYFLFKELKGNFRKLSKQKLERIGVYKDLINYSKKYLPEKTSLKTKVIFYISDKKEFFKCHYCGKYLNKDYGYVFDFSNYLDSFSNFQKRCIEYTNKTVFCSYKCSSSDPITQNKNKQTCLKKYGYDCSFSNKDFREKCSKSFQEKYNVDNPMKLKKIKEKLKRTVKEKYRVEYISQTKEWKEKVKQTCLEKYNVEHPLQDKKIYDKIKQTCLEKYGVDNVSKTDFVKKKISDKIKSQIKEIQKKREETYLKKYGVKNISLLEEIQEKKRQTSHKRMFLYLTSKNVQNQLKIKFISPKFIGDGKEYKWKCLKCGYIFEKIYANGIIPKCPKCYPIKYQNQQNEVIKYLKNTLKINNIKINSRTIIPPKELDIYCSDHNIAIEYNGLYWHSHKMLQDKFYHQNKTLECIEKGIQLIHIFENEWLYKQKIVKNKLKILFNKIKYKIPGRKCIIKEIDNDLKNKFLNKYHLQGIDNSTTKLGAFYKNRLVAIMTFGKPRFNKNYEWEIYRYCVINNFIIHGIANKLFQYFLKNYNPQSIITYTDLRYSDGNLYDNLNFKLEHITNPNYFYVKDGIIYSRHVFQKHKLKDKLEFYNKNLTEQENMALNNYDIIYDCGNLVFSYTRTN